MSDWLRESVKHRLGLPPGEPLPPTLSVEQAGKVLGVSRGSAYDAARSGELPVIQIGRRKRVPTQKLLELLSESSRPAGADDPSPVQPRPLLLEEPA